MTDNAQSTGRRSTVRRQMIAFALLAGAVLGLSGCAAMIPEMGNYKTTIPEALKASDLGVLEVAAGSSIDGASRSVGVHVYLDRDSITSEELHETLSIVVPLINQPGADKLKLTFSDASDGFNADSDFWSDFDISDAKQQLLDDWGPDKAFGFADTKDDQLHGKISALKQYLRDTE